MTDTPMSPALEQAEIARKAAETRKLTLEAEGVALANRLKEVEIRKEGAVADKERAMALYQGLSYTKAKRSDELELIRSHYHHEYLFAGVVDEDTVDPCLMQMAAWHRENPGKKDAEGNVIELGAPMNIYVDSPGGSCSDGFHLFDQIYHYSLRGGGTHKVTIIVRGMAASMAGILVQAADERVMGANAQMLIHQVSTWAQGSTGDLEDVMERLNMLNDQVIDSFMERANSDQIDRQTFAANWKRRDWWLRAKQAKEYGFVDRIG